MPTNHLFIFYTHLFLLEERLEPIPACIVCKAKAEKSPVTVIVLTLNAAHFKNNCMVYALGCKDVFQIVIAFYFLYSKSPSMVKVPTSLVVDTPTAKEMGYVLTSYPKEKVLYFNLFRGMYVKWVIQMFSSSDFPVFYSPLGRVTTLTRQSLETPHPL